MSPEDVLKQMTSHDHFTKWLGLEIEQIGAGSCTLHYTIRREMLNGFGSIHGGVIFSAADSAFAFACNSYGQVSVALEVSISFTRPALEGDVLHVEAKEIHLGNKTGLYEVRTTNSKGELVALFKGTSYKTGKSLQELRS